MSAHSIVLRAALLLALFEEGDADSSGRRRGRIAHRAGSFGMRVLDEIDPDAVVQRVDVDALLRRIDVDGLLERVDVDAALDRVDVDRVLDRVDVDRLLDRVDVDRLVDRIDVEQLLGRADLDALLATVDIEVLVRRAGVPELIAESTGQAATSALDLVRRQLVGVDVGITRLVQRLLRRDLGALPPGPPLLLTDRAGEEQPPRLSASQPRARVEVSGHYAGPVSRVLAFAGDAVGSTATFTAAAVALAWLVSLLTGVTYDVGERAGPWWAAALLAWYLLWWWGTVAVAGRTLGMAVAGLKVVARDGSPVTGGRALARTLLLPFSLAFLGLGFAVALVDRERRAFHDLLAGTAVVYDWGGRPAELPTPISRWLATHGPGQHPPAMSGPASPDERRG